MYTIYLAINYRKRIFYVGQTRDMKNRLKSYKSVSRPANKMHNNSYIHRAMRKYGFDGFLWMILEDGIQSQNEANEFEKLYISRCRLLGLEMYNLTDGGDSEYSFDEVVKKRISEKSKQMWSDPNWKRKKINQQREMCSSPEYKQKISERQKKTWKNDKYRSVASATRKRVWQDDDYKKKMKDMHVKLRENNPEYRMKISNSVKELWKDPEYREKMEKAKEKRIKAIKEKWADPEWKESMRKKISHGKRTSGKPYKKRIPTVT